MAAEYVQFVNYVLNDETLNNQLDPIKNLIWQIGIMCCEGNGKYTWQFLEANIVQILINLKTNTDKKGIEYDKQDLN